MTQTTAEAIFTPANDEINAFQLYGEAWAGTQSLIKWDLEHIRLRPGGIFTPLDIQDNESYAELTYLYPLHLSFNSRLWVYADFFYDSERAMLRGIGARAEDQVRAVTFGFDYYFQSKHSATDIHLYYAQSLDILNASNSNQDVPTINQGACEHCGTYNLQVGHTQYLGKQLTLHFETKAQYALGPAMHVMQFSYGGRAIGRAYDSAEITGDHGVESVFELAYSQPVNSTLISLLHPYVFYDFGLAWRISQLPVRQSAQSAGGGIDIGFFKNNASVRLEIAKPLTKVVALLNNRDARFFFIISISNL